MLFKGHKSTGDSGNVGKGTVPEVRKGRVLCQEQSQLHSAYVSTYGISQSSGQFQYHLMGAVLILLLLISLEWCWIHHTSWHLRREAKKPSIECRKERACITSGKRPGLPVVRLFPAKETVPATKGCQPPGTHRLHIYMRSYLIKQTDKLLQQKGFIY